jgi:hypothetical protein
MSKSQRQSTNAMARANGIEPKPGIRAGVKRWARYIKRTTRKERKAQ